MLFISGTASVYQTVRAPCIVPPPPASPTPLIARRVLCTVHSVH